MALLGVIKLNYGQILYKMFLPAYLFNKENKLADLLYFLFSFPANRMNGKQQQRK